VVLVVDDGRLGRGMLKALNSAAMALTAVGVNSQALDVSGQAPEWIPLVPAGQVVGRDGREWVNDNPQLVLDAVAAGAAALPLDLEHATEKKAPQGDRAGRRLDQGAAGPDGQVWGRVEWTETGRNAVESRSYRYVSPVFIYERASKRVVALTSAALTNRPNLFLQALNGQEERMTLEELLAALGLPKGATFEAGLAHIGKLKGDLVTAPNAAASPSLDKFVPRADFDAALARATNAEASLTALNQQAKDKDITAAIEKALARARSPCHRDLPQGAVRPGRRAGALRRVLQGRSGDRRPVHDGQEAARRWRAHRRCSAGGERDDGHR
jgi:phage I-like protein